MGFKFLLKQAENSHILTTVLEPEDPSYDFVKMHDLLYEKGFTIYPEKKCIFEKIVANIHTFCYPKKSQDCEKNKA